LGKGLRVEVTSHNAVRRRHAKRKLKRIKGKVLEEQGNKCYYCEICFTYETLPVWEHKTPLALGGSAKADNVVLSCRACDKRKGTKTAEEFLTSKWLSNRKHQLKKEKERERDLG
jgi:5-methylcytosine-specific restriction endonuclease McrA